MSRFTRLLALVAVPVALMVAVAPSATAVPREVEEPGEIELAAGLGCDFPLRLEASAGQLREVTFTSRNGEPVRMLSVRTGVVLTYTNLATQESISIKTSGSVSSAVMGADGVTATITATGHNALILFPNDVPAGPTTTQYNGRIVFAYNTVTGFIEVIRTSGKATDICAELS